MSDVNDYPEIDIKWFDDRKDKEEICIHVNNHTIHINRKEGGWLGISKGIYGGIEMAKKYGEEVRMISIKENK